MTPKEKAKELFLGFRQIPPSSPYTGIDDGEAIECALICVDEVINSMTVATSIHLPYWREVKQEIKKL